MEKIFQIIIIVECILFIIIHKSHKYSFTNIVQLQNIVWLCSYIIYLSGIFNFYPMIDKVYYASYLYLLFFNIAFVLKNNQNRDLFSKKNIEKVKKTYNSKIGYSILFFSIIAWILSINIMKKTLPILFSLGLNMLRYIIYSENTVLSTLEMMIINYIIRPIGIVSIIVFSIQLSLRKLEVKVLICALINSFGLIFLTAGRAMFVQLCLYVLVAMVIVNKANLKFILQKYKKYLIPTIIVLLIILSISSQRLNRDYGIIHEGIIYYVSGLPYFSKLLDTNILPNTYMYGRITFAAFLDIPILLLKYLIGMDIELGNQIVSSLTNNTLQISPDISMNAMASTLISFYLDFGIIGICGYSFLLGLFLNYFEMKVSNNFTMYTLAMYLYFLVGIVQSIQNYQFESISNCVVIFFIYVIVKLNLINKKMEE